MHIWQVIRRTECQLQQAHKAARNYWIRADKPEEAGSELKQVDIPPSIHHSPHFPTSSRRPPQLPPSPPRGLGELNQLTNPQH